MCSRWLYCYYNLSSLAAIQIHIHHDFYLLQSTEISGLMDYFFYMSGTILVTQASIKHWSNHITLFIYITMHSSDNIKFLTWKYRIMVQMRPRTIVGLPSTTSDGLIFTIFIWNNTKVDISNISAFVSSIITWQTNSGRRMLIQESC